MFLENLTIRFGDGTIIREINFHSGLNLIVDETNSPNTKSTGNNVGKTTVLKLVDFCLGASGKSVYTEDENTKNEYQLVKDFLIKNKVIISLCLKGDLQEKESWEILIERNFLLRNEKIQRINGIEKDNDKFEEALTDILFPGHFGKKPTFSQIIAHNIRYKDLAINHTLKNVNRYTKDVEYETLNLFLFGCSFSQGDRKQQLKSLINAEETFKRRLEIIQTKSGYEAAFSILEIEIQDLEKQKTSFNLNPNFESDLNHLNKIKYQINFLSSEITQLELRRNLIFEAQADLQTGRSNVDLIQLRQIYNQATSLVGKIQKTFEELNEFHNQMIASKIKFLSKDLPEIDEKIHSKRVQLKQLLEQEAHLSKGIVKSDAFESLEVLITELNSKYQLKGEYENILKQLSTIDSTLYELKEEMGKVEKDLFSEEFSTHIKKQLFKFNQYFSYVSNELYGEKYAIKMEEKTVKNHRLYEFSTFNTNFSSGKKQGEISSFDIAYTLFADAEDIPCMHFLLNDKKELMHGNQLLNIANLISTKEIQFVASILQDKLPPELNKEEYIIAKFSQDNKIFRIEELKGLN